jgi:prepilin-type N-terminal cleavage/methylation domain-containing protein
VKQALVPSGPHSGPYGRHVSTMSRLGFSFIEVLFVAAILGILAGIGLVALQGAKGSAKRIDCINNLKQIGLACHIYHDSGEHFPTEFGGTQGFYEQILPCIECTSLSPKVLRPVRIFVCPARHGASAPWRDYVYVYDNKLVNSPILYEKDGATLGSITIASGSCNTALLSHIWMDPDTYETDTAAWADPLHQVGSAVSKPDVEANAGGLGSLHPRVMPFVFADGHAQHLPYGWDQPTGAENWLWNWKNTNAFQLP